MKQPPGRSDRQSGAGRVGHSTRYYDYDAPIFEDAPKRLPERVPVGSRLLTRLGEVYTFSPWHLAAGCMAWWSYRVVRTANKLLTLKYADVAYQLRRPDSIANRVRAFKVLVIGGCAIPLLSTAAVYAHLRIARQHSPPELEGTEAEMTTASARRSAAGNQASNTHWLPSATRAAIESQMRVVHDVMRMGVKRLWPSKDAWRQWKPPPPRS
eukprot:GHVU01221558.1.p1 GENE.GHVU01221558.1~~GHVU01221558.1.p1  ORF type:complete len:211 (+),score=22.70 GHVU01221558.1:1749-2381(+)